MTTLYLILSRGYLVYAGLAAVCAVLAPFCMDAAPRNTDARRTTSRRGQSRGRAAGRRNRPLPVLRPPITHHGR